MNLTMKTRLISLSCTILCTVLTTFLVTYIHFIPKPEKPFEDFNDRINEIRVNSQYSFLPKEIEDYILESCENLGVDPDLCLAILINENPEINFTAVNSNANGTADVGLWQINDKYLWTTFKDDFWVFEDVELNPFNWKHNTYIALRIIQDNCKTFSTFDERVMAYNCGCGAVMNDKIPASTYKYLASAKINYELLKSGTYK